MPILCSRLKSCLTPFEKCFEKHLKGMPPNRNKLFGVSFRRTFQRFVAKIRTLTPLKSAKDTPKCSAFQIHAPQTKILED